MPNGDSSRVRPFVFGPDKLNVALDSETDNGELAPFVFSTTLLDSMDQASEYNKDEQLYKSTNISISLQDNTSTHNLPVSFSPFSIGLSFLMDSKEQERFGGDILSGVVGTTAGVLGFLDYLVYIQSLGTQGGEGRVLDNLGKGLNEISAGLMPKDPKFIDHLFSGVGSMAMFMVPGGATALGIRAAGLGSKMAVRLGLTVMTLLEAGTEAGSVWQDTHSPDATNKTFGMNLIVLGLTNFLGLGNTAKRLLTRILIASPLEGIQEGAQTIIVAIAKGEPIPWKEVWTSVGVGAIIGGGATAFIPVGGRDAEYPELLKTPEVQAKLDAAKTPEFLELRDKIGAITNEDIGIDQLTDLETPQKFLIKDAPEISLSDIDLEGSGLEDVEESEIRRVKLLETRGLNTKGQPVGTVAIVFKKTGIVKFEVIFNKKGKQDGTQRQKGRVQKEEVTQRSMPEALRETKAGFTVYQQFGSRIDPEMKNVAVNKKIHDTAMRHVNSQLPTNIQKTDEELVRWILDDHIDPNILDGIFVLGRHNFIAYLNSLESQNSEFNFSNDFIQNHPANHLSNEVLHAITDKASNKILNDILKNQPDIFDKINTKSAQLDEEQTAKLDQDIIVGMASNFDDVGWSLVRKKWENTISKRVLNRIIAKADKINSPITKQAGINSLGTAFNELYERVRADVVSKSIEELDETKANHNQEREDIDEALPDPDDTILDQGVFNQERFGIKPYAVAMRLPDGTVHKGKPGDIHAIFYDRFPSLFPDDNIPFAGEMGYVDKEGTFITKEQTRKITGGTGESISEGIAKAGSYFISSKGIDFIPGTKPEKPIDPKSKLGKALDKRYLEELDSLFPLDQTRFGFDKELKQFSHLAMLKKFSGEPRTTKNDFPVLFASYFKEIKALYPNLTENDIKAAANYAWAIDEAKFAAHEEVYLDAEENHFRLPPELRLNFKETLEEQNLQDFLVSAPFKDVNYEKGIGLLREFQQRNFRQGVENVPAYKELLKTFEGKSLEELHSYLKGQGLVDEQYSEILSKLIPIIGKVPLVIESMPTDIPGRYIPEGYKGGHERIIINPEALAFQNTDPLKTLLHEAIHAWTVGFIRSAATGNVQAQRFVKELEQMIEQVRKVITNPQDAVNKRLWHGSTRDLNNFLNDYNGTTEFRKEIDNYLGSVEEFLGGVISDTTRLRDFLLNISAVSAIVPGTPVTSVTPKSLWQQVWDKLKSAWSNIFKPTDKGNLAQTLTSLMSSYHEPLRKFNVQQRFTANQIKEARALSMETKTSGTESEEETSNQLDIDQLENADDISEEAIYEKNIIRLAAELEGSEPGVFRNRIKRLPNVHGFYDIIDEIDLANSGIISEVINDMWEKKGYKQKVSNRDEFELRFLTGLFNFLKSSKVSPFVTIRVDYTGRGDSKFSILEEGQIFKTGDGVTNNSYTKRTVLDSYLGQLAVFFGIHPKDINITYVSGFETWRNGQFQRRASLDRLTPYAMGSSGSKITATQMLSNRLWSTSSTGKTDKAYIYLGNFGGKDTVPLISIPKDSIPLVKDKVDKFLASLGGSVDTFKVGEKMTMAFRLALMDMWHNKVPGSEESVFRLNEAGEYEFGDLNKMWKRDGRFLVEDGFISTDKETMKRVLGKNRHLSETEINRAYSGVRLNGENVMLNSFVFSSNDEGAIQYTSEYDAKNQPIVEDLPIQLILKNTYGTPRSDGPIYFLIDEFDHLYHNTFGTIKDGVIKAVYSSRSSDKNSLFLKFAFHGVTRESALGQFMVKNNLALLISDEAAKVGATPGNMSEGIGEGAFEINLKNFQQIKEALNLDIEAGPTKQWHGGTGLVQKSPLLEQTGQAKAYTDAIRNHTDQRIINAMDKVNEMGTAEGLVNILKDIVRYPSSPREEAISRTLRNYINIPTDQFIKQFGAMINHPTIAKQLRQRLYKPIDLALQGHTGGMRLTLRPDIGKGNTPANIDPVTNNYNLDMILINQKSDSVPHKHAFPEPGLSSLVKQMLELNRMETRMATKNTYEKDINGLPQVDWIKAKKAEVKQQIQQIGLESSDPDRKAALMTGDIRKAVNHDAYIKTWKKENVFKEILDPDSGTLRRGWVIVTNDYAAIKGIKPGDRLLLPVTPSSSPLGVFPVRVAGIAPVNHTIKVTDRMTIVLNSEDSQSIVGKDFDIDDIGAIEYDPDYWTAEDFFTVWDTMDKLHPIYRKWMAGEASKMLKVKLDESTVFNPDVFAKFQEKFLNTHLGDKDTGRLAGVDQFDPIDHFFAIDNAYLFDPSKAVVASKFHTALSAIDFKSKKGQGPNTNKSAWKIAHLLHLFDVEVSVDFPGKTTRMKYNPSTSKEYAANFASLEWNGGQTLTEEEYTNTYVPVIEFMKWVIGDTLTLASGEDNFTGRRLEYYDARQLIKIAQNKLQLLQNKDFPSLLNLWAQSLQRKFDEAKATKGSRTQSVLDLQNIMNQKMKTVHEFFAGGIDISSIADYPLFQTVMGMDVNKLPMPGTSYEDWLIDQSITTKEMMQTSTFLKYFWDRHILSEFDKEPGKKTWFTTPPDVGTDKVKQLFKEITNQFGSWEINIHRKVNGILKNKILKPHEKADAILRLRPELDIHIAGHNRANVLINMLDEYGAIRQLAGKPYGIDATRGGERYGLTNVAIALSILPRELDHWSGRKGKESSLNQIRNEIISIMQANDEVAQIVDKNGHLSVTGEAINENRKGREVSFPILLSQIMSEPRIKFIDGARPQYISHKGVSYLLSLNYSGQLFVGKGSESADGQFSGRLYDHTAINSATTDETKELKTLLTERNGFWEGWKNNSEGTANRFALSSILQFPDNVNVDQRIVILKDTIQKKVYGPEASKFDRVDIQALWLSFLAQVTNDGLRDNKAPGLITAKLQFDSTKPVDFQGNDVALELLAEFEPSLFRLWMSVYNEVNQTMNRVDQEIGIQGLASSQEAAAQMFDQKRFDETDGPATVQAQFKLLQDEIVQLTPDISTRKFGAIITKKGYSGGLSILKDMVKGGALLEALAQNEIFYGDLLHDINKLSAKAFEKKYETRDIDLVNATASSTLSKESYIQGFLSEQFGTHNYENIESIPKLIQIYAQFKAAIDGRKRVDKILTKRAKSAGINFISYKFLGPLKENKVYAGLVSSVPIDIKYTPEGTEQLSLLEVDTAMRRYSTVTTQFHGESSVVITKNQILHRTLNRYNTELASVIEESDETTHLLMDEAARQKFLTEKSVTSEPRRKDWMRTQIQSMEPIPRVELWDVKRRIFDTAENFATREKIEVLSLGGEVTGYRDISAGVVYQIGEIPNATFPQVRDKYELIDKLYTGYNSAKKLEVLAALDFRELYDVQVPHIIQKTLEYLEKTSELVGTNYDLRLEVQGLVERYRQYRDQISANRGKYMPHMYPVETYKAWWHSEQKEILKQTLIRQVKKAESQLKAGQNPDMSLIDMTPDEMKAKLNAIINREWEQWKVGNPSGYVIPNFMPRRVKETFDLTYQKGTSEMHYNYINNLMQGLKNDLVYADWLAYLHKARRNGERTSIIEMTKLWYADQIQNKMMHTKSIEIKKLRPGMQINFKNESGIIDLETNLVNKASIEIWGVVEKVDIKGRRLKLKVDKDKVIYRARQAIRKNESLRDNLTPGAMVSNATSKQIVTISNLLKQGFLQTTDLPTSMDKMAVSQALTVIIKGNNNVIANIDQIGIYDLNGVFTLDMRGKIISNVNRYMRRGAIERLEGRAREVDNIKGPDGHFDNILDATLYRGLKVSAFAAVHGTSIIKQSQAMVFLGMVVAPKAFIYNYMGARASNLLDAPFRHRTTRLGDKFFNFNPGLGRKSKEEWASIENMSPSEMTREQRDWYNTMVSLGLSKDDSLVAISLMAGNIDPVDILSQEGGLDAVRYLIKGIVQGGAYQKYLVKMDKLRTDYILSDFDQDIYHKIYEEEQLWRAEVDGLVNKKISKLTKAERNAVILKVDQKQIAGEKLATSFSEETDLTRSQALKLAGKLLRSSIMRGWFGLGLQAKAEILRRPAFYIGYQTALDLGFNREQALQLGVNSIEYRHAFYGTAYKQYGANTRLGALMMQFSQYSYNNFTQGILVWKEAIPQTMSHWAQVRIAQATENKNTSSRFKRAVKTIINPAKAFSDIVFRRMTPLLDANGKRLKNAQNVDMGEVNLAHYLMNKWILSMMLMQAGSRIFYGITNWQDPMVQLVYEVFDIVTDLFKGDLDLSGDDLAELAWLMADMMFFLGVPYKLGMQYFFRNPDADDIEVYYKGRIEDHADFIYRTINQIKVWDNPMLAENPKYKRRLFPKGQELSYVIDDFFLGMKFFGYTKPDSEGEPYWRYGIYPGFSNEFPFIMKEEYRQIKPLNNTRYIEMHNRFMGLEERLPYIVSPLTWLPFADKLFYPHKDDR